MKAAIYSEYGPPEVVTIEEIEKPTPKDHEILVKVYASTVNQTDCGFRSANYFVVRLFSGLFKPKNKTLGCEFAGVVEEIGAKVTSFQPGDRVFGFNDASFGGHAEYMTIAEKKGVTTLPDKFTFEEGAPLTEGAHYALNVIKAADVRIGQQVMVYGSTGAIGSAALQILKHFGATVTAVCNTKNVNLMEELGANEIIDYQKTDFRQTNDQYDFILDAVGKTSFRECKPLLNKKGIYISTELGKNAANIFLSLLTPFFGGKRVKFPIPKMNKEIVEYLKKLAVKGKFTPIIDRTYPLEEIVDAYRYVETGQKTGNVVLRIREEKESVNPNDSPYPA